MLTSPTCPYCPKAREVVKRLAESEKDVIAMELDATTEEGLKKALKFGIRAVPAIIINDLVGVPSLNELKRMIRGEVIA